MNKKLNSLLVIVKLILDGAAVYVSFLAAYWFRFNVRIIPVTKGVPLLRNYVDVLPVVVLIFLGVFKWSRFYERNKILYRTDEFINVLKACFAAILITTAATFIYREYSYSRAVIGYAFLFNVLFVYSLHRILRNLRVKVLVKYTGKEGILVVGGERVRERLVRNISKRKEFKVFFTSSINLNNIKKYLKNNKINEIVLADSDYNREEVLKLINYCEQNDIEFKMVPDMLELKMGEMSFDSYFGIPVLHLRHPLFEASNYYFKRTLDIIMAMAALLVSAPFLIFITIAIKIDSKGPVIYSHLRKGYRGRCFPFFKFRSMVEDADRQLKDLLAFNEREGLAFKMKNDPRVTKVGRFIRKYSLDEIPQLFNVLRGDMSLVGPRPQVLWEAEYYDEEARRRLNILPGITGLWQISGRSDLSYEEMINLDLYYLENWTPGLDIKILLKTIPVVVLKKGAC